MSVILPYKGVLPKIADDAFVAPNAAVIGDVEIGSRSSIWFGCVVRGDVNIIRIGRGSNVQDGTIIHVTRKKFGTIVGDNVLVGHMCLIHGCTLEDSSFVGMKACVMDGAVVETHAMVAAGALVTPGKRVRSGELWAGSPAKKMRDLTPEEIAYIDESAKVYADNAALYRREAASAANCVEAPSRL
jgi:carbonic anhydrase/acetyltransferase-like protein (isoleucine patch superfamily)